MLKELQKGQYISASSIVCQYTRNSYTRSSFIFKNMINSDLTSQGFFFSDKIFKGKQLLRMLVRGLCHQFSVPNCDYNEATQAITHLCKAGRIRKGTTSPFTPLPGKQKFLRKLSGTITSISLHRIMSQSPGPRRLNSLQPLCQRHTATSLIWWRLAYI